MNIDLNFILIIIINITCLISNFAFYWGYSKLGSFDGNPQHRKVSLKRVYIPSIINVLLIIALVLLRFKFWYISLILSSPTILIFICMIYYVLEELFG